MKTLTREQIIEELEAIYNYMDSKGAVYGFGQIGDLINKLKSELSDSEPKARTAEEIRFVDEILSLKSQPERGEQPSAEQRGEYKDLSEVKNIFNKYYEYIHITDDDEKKEERCGTCGMLMDIKSEPEYICMNPDCENYCKTNK